MTPSKPNAFGKAKPAQSPKYVMSEGELDDYDDEPVYRKPPVQAQGASTVILSIICLTCVLCMGALGVIYLLNAPTEVQAMQQSNHRTNIDGEQLFAKKFHDCTKRALRGVNKSAREFREAIEEARISFGQPSITGNPRLILCLSESPRKYFCDKDFRQGFNKHVSEFQSSHLIPNQVAQDMTSMISAFSEDEPRIDYLNHAERKIRSLFQEGHLRRDEFSGYFSGEPKWLTRLFTELEPVPTPC